MIAQESNETPAAPARRPLPTPPRRRPRPAGPLVLAFAAALAALALGCSKDDTATAARNDDDESIRPALSPDESPPTFEFPDDIRSSNDELNAFIDELRRIFTEGRYREYRLSTSRLIEPVERRRFEGLWHAVRAVRVELIKRLPESLELPNPAYAVLVSADVRENYALDRPHRVFSILVFKEEGQWVIAPAPENVNRAMHKAANLATEPEDPFTDDQSAPTSRPAEALPDTPAASPPASP